MNPPPPRSAILLALAMGLVEQSNKLVRAAAGEEVVDGAVATFAPKSLRSRIERGAHAPSQYELASVREEVHAVPYPR